jgi:hypothetical protein
MFTLIMTAKLNDVDPQAWLADVFTHIAALPQSRLHELLPWEWKKRALLAAAAGAMAAITRVFTIRRAAEILGRDEDLLWDISDQLDPEDGKLWIYDVDGIEIMAFTDFGLENLREIISDQIDRTA